MQLVKSKNVAGVEVSLWKDTNRAQVLANGKLRRNVFDLSRADAEFNGECEYIAQLMELPEYKSGMKTL